MDRSKLTPSTVDETAEDTGTSGATGLRARQKAKRREVILAQAKAFFAEKGVDAVTMAEIAEAAGVSTPTVFNYFGNKDGILIALITEGTRKARDNSKVLRPRTDVDFVSTLLAIFIDISVETMAIASKRIWRYAHAASTRHPTTEFAKTFQEVDNALLDLTTGILSQYSLRLHDGTQGEARHIAHLFFDVWLNTFQDFIRSPDMTIETHGEQLRARFAPLCWMIFAPDFLAAPTLASAR
ncbi:transcriptional regulator, TetR family [Pseudosulfitobacter pseudonitzschiae]|uniref:TetR/AcrR family transcriptional regulator n=1 Tax=Pseudosulfitobacter pseudonitzschiae TaxID=1402135 RepID=UPI000921F604|nr:TetR/AcrR family transcriptional regulator [Pseudosulfitobacter pseudonitzschiae]SHE93339.1 transcriptional regulator, TetR family [Pseudosulfitobacter pseudonitzschiae]